MIGVQTGVGSGGSGNLKMGGKGCESINPGVGLGTIRDATHQIICVSSVVFWPFLLSYGQNLRYMSTERRCHGGR